MRGGFFVQASGAARRFRATLPCRDHRARVETAVVIGIDSHASCARRLSKTSRQRFAAAVWCRSTRRRFAAALVACAALGAGPAAAQLESQRGPALNWVRLPGAESCIGPVELAERVEQRLGRHVFAPMSAAIVVIEGFVSPRPGGFGVALRVSNRDGVVYGSRELAVDERDCRKLDELAALVIAVTIHGQGGSSGIALPPEITAELDALFAGEPGELDPAALPPASETPAASPPQTPPPRPTPTQMTAPQRAVSFGVGAGLAVVTGLQPSGTLAPVAHLALRDRSLGALVLSGSIGLPSHESVEDPPLATGTLTFRAIELALAVCAPELSASFSAVDLCVTAGGGWLRAGASGFAAYSGHATKPWFEVGPEASVRSFLAGPLYVRLAGRLPVRLSRPRFEYYSRRDARRVTAFAVDAVGVGAELALGIDFF
jgi:hypothetical protein